MPFPELTPLAAHAVLHRFRIIDVREDYEYCGPLGFVEGAESIPLSTVAARAEQLSGSLPLLLICRSGKRSGKACETLQEFGIESVTNLEGGMIGWNRARLPVERTALKTLEELIGSIVSWIAQVTGTTQDDARSKFYALLLESGAAADEVTHTALDYALDALSDDLQQAGAPADLELVAVAYRKDLAVI
jgi:rhodanese-related sulfurtransferase